MIPRLRQNDNPRLLKRLSPAEKLKLGISDGGGGGATTFDASAIISGTMAVARLGSGTANGTTVLYGDNTWAAPPGAGSGTPVGVDGAAALASADLNSTTPAAPAGSLNVDFQVSGTSVSAFTKTDNASLEINASAIRRAALTGDVTATAGSNATTIANDAVTYAKMQNVSATDKLLGRSTAGAGDVEEIACTAAGRALLDDATAGDQRTTLGLGASAVRSDPWPVGSIFMAVVATNPNTLLGYGTWAALAGGKVLIGDNGGTYPAGATGGAETVAASAQTFAGNALGTHQHAAKSAGTPSGTNANESAHTHQYTDIPDHAHPERAQGGTTASTTGTHVMTSTATGGSIRTIAAGENTLANTTGSPGVGNPGTTLAGSAHTHAFTGDALATHQHDAITAGTPSGTNTPGAATSVVQPYLVVYMWSRTA